MRGARGVVILLLALPGSPGCAREDVELAAPVRPRAVVAGAPPPSAGRAAPPQPPVTPSRAAEVFEHALCVCTSALFTGALAIDAFDSTDGPYRGPESGADVGVNEQLATLAAVDVRGAVTAAGSGPLTLTNGPVQIEDDFRSNSALVITSAEVGFGRDLWVNGEIQALGSVTVAGDVYQTPGHAGAQGLMAAGRVRMQDFAVQPPCACAEDELLDVAALVDAGMADNDNAALGVAPDALHTAPGDPALELACGRYGMQGGNVLAGTAVRARGRAALFVAGDLVIAGRFGAELGADDALDVFVSGTLILIGGAEVGTPAHPAALRFYVGGASDLTLIDELTFAANLYAPRTNVVAVAEQELFGSLFVAGFQGIVGQILHRDRAIARARDGEGCVDVP
jgi:hypothetical protein